MQLICLAEGGTLVMKKRQCKYCNKYGGETGTVVLSTIEENSILPGPIKVSRARIYTVECVKCRHKWQYRKKIK